jgi:NAD(P)-dependent dehydrogenase (short-subunit alcohol dehydrogenase family)
MTTPETPTPRFGVVAVTGAAHGIGREIAKESARRGARVVWAMDRNAEGLESLAADVADGCEVRVVVGDLSATEVTDDLASRWRQGAPPELLVNCAGIRHSASVLDTSDEQWLDTLAVNLTAPFRLMKAAVAAMQANEVKDGVIVNIASIAGEIGFTERAAYCASKAGLIGLTRAAALDLGRAGIRVFSISPGFQRTGISDDLPDSSLKVVPLGRRGEPAELARLLHDIAESSYVTGANFVVDGGSSVGQMI